MSDRPNVDLSTNFKVGDWAVHPNSGLLVRGDEEVKIEPKVMEVLVYLAQNQGNVVSREALESSIWAGTVVGYDAVSGSIIKLRKALGDDTRQPRYIKTVSKRGYQLIASVTASSTENPPSVTPDTTPTSEYPTEKQSTFKRSSLLLGGIIVISLFGYFGKWIPSDRQSASVTNLASVVVLPFKNLSDDTKQDYLSNGITDDLITDLSRSGKMRVIAPQSSYHYKNNPINLSDIARELNVLYIVEGSVRKTDKQIRVNVQLTNTEKGLSIWAQRFDTNTSELFNVQDTISKQVLAAMQVTAPGDGSGLVEKRPTYNFQAYNAFLVGLQQIEMRNKQGYDLAVNSFQRSLEIDPGYARAYSALAVTLSRGYRYQWSDLSMVEARERALEFVNRAIELNQSIPEIYWASAYVHLHRREFKAAEEAAKQSVSLSPNYADGYAMLANIALWRGKPSEAISYIQRAKDLNPHFTFQYPSTLGMAEYQLGHYRDAIASLKDSLLRNESALNPRIFLAAAYVQLKQMDDASWEIDQIKITRPDIQMSHLDTLLPFEDNKFLIAIKKELKLAGLPG